MTQRTPVVATVVVNCQPAASRAVPRPYNAVGVAEPAPAPRPDIAAPTAAAPLLLTPGVNPYMGFMEAVRTNQEWDFRTLQQMVEHRQANLAVIRSMQAADANAVAAFEKLVRQMKADSPKATPVPATPAAPAASPMTDAPRVVTLPIAPPPAVVAPAPAGPSPKEIQALMEELERLSQKVKELNGQMQASPDK